MIVPAATVGILGGGQLGRMLGVAARQLGYGVAVLAPPGDNPAAAVADRVFLADYEDPDALRAFADACAVVTYEFENVPAGAVASLAALRPVHPSAELLAWTQDRVQEHALLDRLGIPSAPGGTVVTAEELDALLVRHGTPSRLKSARGGYDGGGQWRIRAPEEVEAARAALGGGRRFRFERDVPFDLELSVVVARAASGAHACFPLFENTHEGGILVRTRAPAAVPQAVADRARAIAITLAEAVHLVGTLTVECFVVGGEVLVNELAPRVHNSGHLTIEAASVSQFEQHLRAVCGLPLAEPVLRAPAVMLNLLGDLSGPVRLDGLDRALAVPEAHVHLYGKQAVRPRRKMGHVTALGATLEEAEARAVEARAALRFG